MEDEAWKKLSSDFPWTERMLEKYRNKVDWEEVSNNYNMLWTPSMLDKFKWKINWHQLSSRSSEALMITENIERFETTELEDFSGTCGHLGGHLWRDGID